MNQHTFIFSTIPATSVEALQIADGIIAQRYGESLGLNAHAQFLDAADRWSTVHLNPGLARRALDASGRQRRDTVLTVASDGGLKALTPVYDIRLGCDVAVITDYPDLIDMWGDLRSFGAWSRDYKGVLRTDSQIRVALPFVREGEARSDAVAAQILNAKPGQRSHTRDGNPLNLVRANLRLSGVPSSKGGASKYDRQAKVRERAEVREAYAGRNLGPDLS